jgi:hypothetical protein
MRNFYMSTAEPINGSFELKALNLAFVFQLNCPGCFLYGFPMMNALFEKYTERIGIVGISTAFEDFQWNTEANTRALVNEGTVVGETLEQLKTGAVEVPGKIHFPIVFDNVTEKDHALTVANLERIASNNPNYFNWPKWEQQALMANIKSHYEQFPLIAETFVFNQLAGTPTFVIFNKEGLRLRTLFGFRQQDVLEQYIDDYLLKG